MCDAEKPVSPCGRAVDHQGRGQAILASQDEPYRRELHGPGLTSLQARGQTRPLSDVGRIGMAHQKSPSWEMIKPFLERRQRGRLAITVDSREQDPLPFGPSVDAQISCASTLFCKC